MSKKYTVMVVDDAALARLVTRNMMADDPHLDVIAFASDGGDAIRQLQEHDPDVILLDLEMPGIDGWEFLRRARSQTRAKIIVISARITAGSTAAREVMDLGANWVVSKPSGSVSLDLKDKCGGEIRRVIYTLLDITD